MSSLICGVKDLGTSPDIIIITLPGTIINRGKKTEVENEHRNTAENGRQRALPRK